MWNCCLRKNRVSAQDENVEKITTFSSFKLETARREGGMKKRVRFRIQDGKGSRSNSTSGPVRIRLVVTKEELKRVLRNKNEENDPQHTSLEQLLSDMMLREKRVCEIGKYGGSINSWRPALESIPEDRSMK